MSAYETSFCPFPESPPGNDNRPGKNMDVSLDEELTALEACSTTATRARELAQNRIVSAFRSQLEGAGPGPSDAQVQSFARLALVERALQKELRSVAELIGVDRLSAAPETIQ
ncbi:hypothetical protein [Variovorax sp. HW608]|uniref:hypothetical protein n=1 Tax=Variovorax sp. HW608 TaxID=1034889 RepID=UPI0012FDB014|nr:hypothetical protein [Variovorax sp. HW608]